jgi:hypothetical protein
MKLAKLHILTKHRKMTCLQSKALRIRRGLTLLNSKALETHRKITLMKSKVIKTFNEIKLLTSQSSLKAPSASMSHPGAIQILLGLSRSVLESLRSPPGASQHFQSGMIPCDGVF